MADEHPSAPHFYYFEKEFDAPAGAMLRASICGDTRYALYLNGHLVSEGPCQGSSYVTYYESEDLTSYIVPGINKLTAKVLYVTEGWFISVYRRSNPAFWFDGTLTTPDGTTVSLSTDDSWVCTRENACTFHNTPGVHVSIPPFEDWRGASDPVTIPVRIGHVPDLNKHCYNIFGLGEPYIMTPRPIPQMETETAAAMLPVRSGDGFVEYDAGSYTTSKVALRFRAKAGTTIRIIYAECYSVADEAGNRYKDLRDDYTHPTAEMGGVWDTLVATGEAQEFLPFWYRSFRFARIECPSDADFELLEFTQSPYHYPLDRAGEFSCSDERLNRMWTISRNTVLCCMHEMYVDCPFYEQQQYDMDSALEMLFTLRMSADGRMPYKSLCDLAQSQMADGMIQANYPSVCVQIIPDFTLFWVLMLRDYLRYCGRNAEELARVRALTGTMDKALEAFLPYMTESGLIGVTPYWHFVDWVPGWFCGIPTGGDKEPLTVTSMMYAAALNAASEICEAVGRPGLAEDYRCRASDMLEHVRAICYDEAVGLFRDTPSLANYSQHTTLWAILSGAVSGSEAGALVDRTFDGQVPVNVCTFSMNHYMFRALELADRYEYAPRQLAGWQKMLDWHCTSWCENPDSPRSECHGWSSAPIYEFSEMVLGVYPTSDGYRSVRIKPYIHGLGLTHAEGTVPTPVGSISVAWKIKNGVFTLNVKLPDGVDMPATIILPNDTSAEMYRGAATYTCSVE